MRQSRRIRPLQPGFQHSSYSLEKSDLTPLSDLVVVWVKTLIWNSWQIEKFKTPHFNGITDLVHSKTCNWYVLKVFGFRKNKLHQLIGFITGRCRHRRSLLIMVFVYKMYNIQKFCLIMWKFRLCFCGSIITSCFLSIESFRLM